MDPAEPVPPPPCSFLEFLPTSPSPPSQTPLPPPGSSLASSAPLLPLQPRHGGKGRAGTVPGISAPLMPFPSWKARGEGRATDLGWGRPPRCPAQTSSEPPAPSPDPGLGGSWDRLGRLEGRAEPAQLQPCQRRVSFGAGNHPLQEKIKLKFPARRFSIGVFMFLSWLLVQNSHRCPPAGGSAPGGESSAE